ncbi:uncharacterized protein (DUF2384 family) [Paenalcaligenes hominis]|uniref:Uncharacterized protein (DUF2384 family) n=1 Tax=Paenalcaligenes hominis TaxID=643674 RepID=A0ABX0WMX0_9BURK|nr:MbcA/ParS/Xre antitoxin family protein [Paenalcaligenes hominis]NJB64603.1 uncharacterized protein (DUF2384 family) [Paenalcaligenes hominis]GGE60457.1 hypothetical protein GCM10007278_05870 [Paenalcaligenes hominis]
MGCNAWNHSPDCDCGWGGVWHGSTNRGSWLFNKTAKRELGYQEATVESVAGGYTNPNAFCPVCGDAVYFYESPYGGRIFFDELGPPWPKHPCTYHGALKESNEGILWHKNGWGSLSAVSITSSQADKTLYSIKGKHDGTSHQLYFLSHKPVMADIVRYKNTDQPDTFLVSILFYDPPLNSWTIVNIKAYVSKEAALSEGVFASFQQTSISQKKEPVYQSPALNEENIAKKGAEPNLKAKIFKCNWCSYKGASLLALARHLSDKHGFIALGTAENMTGAFLIPKEVSSNKDKIEQKEFLETERLNQIEQAATSLFKGDRFKASEWMHTPNKYISMLRPASRVKNARQLNVVLSLIERLRAGELD